MGRYSNTKILKNDDGKRHYGITLYPLPLPTESDIYVTTVRGDRLDILANQYYKDSTLYWILLSANNLPTDSLYPPVGTQLRIPSNVSDFLKSFEKINKR